MLRDDDDDDDDDGRDGEDNGNDEQPLDIASSHLDFLIPLRGAPAPILVGDASFLDEGHSPHRHGRGDDNGSPITLG